MKAILFCKKKDSFDVLKPLADELVKRRYDYIWYIDPKLFSEFPYKKMLHTNDLQYLTEFKSDVIFTPETIVPYWLRGVKTHIFNSLIFDEEKFNKMLDYFDLYLTPGPKFTNFFEKMAENQKKKLSVIETGWPKLDTLFNIADDDIISWEKDKLLSEHNVKYIVLYAPSSNEDLSSAKKIKDAIAKLASRNDMLFLVHFSEGMDSEVVKEYKEIGNKNIKVLEESNIAKNMHIADLLISDTTSYIYEFTLLDKPVLSVDTKLKDITWSNVSPTGVYLNVIRTLENRVPTRNKRDQTFKNYHPYNDGKSSLRVIEALEGYLKKHKIPLERKLPFFKKLMFKRALKKY